MISETGRESSRRRAAAGAFEKDSASGPKRIRTMREMRGGWVAGVVSLSLGLSGCVTPTAAPRNSTARSAKPAVSEPVDEAACKSLGTVPVALLPNPDTVIAEAAYMQAQPASSASPEIPAHCLIRGHIARRVGANNQRYQISFEMRLPTAWNGRFFMMGGGGTNGVLKPALGEPGPNRSDTVLGRGFAVISTDGGHDNKENNDPNTFGILTFGTDPQARLDQGYNAYDQTTRLGKALVERYYGSAPVYSYLLGCSEGGREGMMFAQRFPDAYNGVVVGDPGMNIAKMGSAGAWTSKAFASIAAQKDANGAPLINKTFSDQDLMLLRNAVLESCDALDGVKDGIVSDSAACQARFDPMKASLPSGRPLQCVGGKQSDCLTHGQLAALKQAYSAPVDGKGRALYAAWPWDAGVGGLAGGKYNQGWRSWWLGSFASPSNDAARLNGWSAQSALVDWATPPVLIPVAQVAGRTLAYDFDKDPQRIEAVQPPFTVATSAFHVTDVTDLRAFAARGGHMILYHGLSDAAFSANDTVRWYEAMQGEMKERGADVARLYLVPGMNHCSGGPATDSFDMLSPLVDWVENGRAPQEVVAKASTPAYFDTSSRSRPLCPFPQVARYRGAGDIDKAESFVCR